MRAIAQSRRQPRLGFGLGLSLAQRVPYVELRDQAQRGRSTSRLLSYLLGVKAMKDTYAGLGVSHRSGIFGSSKVLGNVNGGSNYIYSYLEWQM